MRTPRPLRHTLSAIGLTLLVAGATEAQVLFEDDLDDNAAGWVFDSLTGGLGVPGSSTAEFGFDYSALGIPEAPNSAPGDTTTSGVRLRTNLGGFGTDQAAVSLIDSDFTGAYTLEVDVWGNFAPDPNGVGTTIHGGVAVGDRLPSTPAKADTPTQAGAGLLLSTVGCLNCGYILLKDEFELDTFSGQYVFEDIGFGNQPGIDRTDSNAIPANGAIFDLPALFPELDISDVTGGAQGSPDNTFDDSTAVGNAAFRWVTVTAVVDPAAPGANGLAGTGTIGAVTYSITDSVSGEVFTIGTIDNSQPDILDDDGDGDDCSGGEDICVNLVDPLAGDTPVSLEGRIALTTIDFFSGGPADSNLGFFLFDNVTVTAASAGIPGDFDGDGDVDDDDFGVFAGAFGGAGPLGDFDADGDVDDDDFGVFAGNFGTGVGTSAAVPEPASMLLVSLAAAVLAASRRA